MLKSDCLLRVIKLKEIGGQAVHTDGGRWLKVEAGRIVIKLHNYTKYFKNSSYGILE